LNKKERVLASIQGKEVDRVPVGFWLHFPQEQHHGQASVEAHIDFFKKTDVDIVKIMNENLVPCTQPIKKATDWKHIRPLQLTDAFVVDQLDIIKKITDAIGSEAVVFTTIHGIVASAFHARGGGDGYDTLRYMLSEHLREQPQIVADAFKIISEGLAQFTEACLQAGAQGIYYAALGGETELFTDQEFERYVKPNDEMILNVVKQESAINFLHICKDKVNLQRYRDYQPDIVNWAIHEGNASLQEGRALFPSSALLGGLDDRSGVLVSGTDEQIREEVNAILQQTGTHKFILGADCTLPTEVAYERIIAAVEAAKQAGRLLI